MSGAQAWAKSYNLTFSPQPCQVQRPDWSAFSMKFQPERLSSEWVVHGYDETGVLINGIKHTQSVVFGTGLSPTAWQFPTGEAFALEQMEWVLNQCPDKTEVLLVGTGKTQQFPPAAIRRFFAERKCPVEYMDSQAACRTYNILVGEGRQVIAALVV